MQKCLLKRAVSFNFLKWKQNLLSLFPFPNLKKKTLCNMKTGQKTAQADNDIKGNKKKIPKHCGYNKYIHVSHEWRI